MKAVVLSGFDEALAMSVQARLEISKNFQVVMNEPELSVLTVPPTVLHDPKSTDGVGQILGELRPVHEEVAELNTLSKERFGPFSGLVLFSASLPKGYEELQKEMVEVDGIPIFQMGSGYHSIVETLNKCNEVRHAFFAFLKHETSKAIQLYKDTCIVVNIWADKGDFESARKELSYLPEYFLTHRQQLNDLGSALLSSRFVRLKSIDSYFLVPEKMAGGIQSHDEVFSGEFVTRQTGASVAVTFLLTKLGEIERAYCDHLSSVEDAQLKSGLHVLKGIIDECARSFLELGKTWQL